MWVLIMTIVAYSAQSPSSVAIVDRIDTQASCEAVGKAWLANISDRSYIRPSYVCYKVRS